MPNWLATLLVSLGFGTGAGIVPVFNNEAFVVGSQITGLGDAAWVIAGLGLGNGIGKTIVLLLLRGGRRLPWWRGDSSRPDPDRAAALARRRPRLAVWVARWHRLVAFLLGTVEDRRWGPAVILLSAATGIPPLYPLTLVMAVARASLGVLRAGQRGQRDPSRAGGRDRPRGDPARLTPTRVVTGLRPRSAEDHVPAALALIT